METVTYSEFCKKLRKYFKQVSTSGEPLEITNQSSQDNVVVMSKKNYDAIMETLAIANNDYLKDKIKRGDMQFMKSALELS